MLQNGRSIIVSNTSPSNRHAALTEISIGRFVNEMHVLPLLRGSPSNQIVEDVEIALVGDLADNPRLLEQVVGDVGTDLLAVGIEVDLQVLAEARRVIVAQRLRVTEGLE